MLKQYILESISCISEALVVYLKSIEHLEYCTYHWFSGDSKCHEIVVSETLTKWLIFFFAVYYYIISIDLFFYNSYIPNIKFTEGEVHDKLLFSHLHHIQYAPHCRKYKSLLIITSFPIHIVKTQFIIELTVSKRT